MTRLPIKYILQGIWNCILDKISDIRYRDVFNKRIKICGDCEHRIGKMCSICGCVIAFKTHAEGSRCPKGKWSAI